MYTKKELLDMLEKRAKKIPNEQNDVNIQSEEFCNDTSLALKKDEIFRLVNSVRNSKKYFYYISNYGRVLILNNESESDPNLEIDKENMTKKTYIIVPIENGYLVETTDIQKFIKENIKISVYKDVYQVMIDAGWLDGDESKDYAEKIVKYNKENKKYPNDRIELHHIDNNPSNNHIDNLIWMPKSMHQHLH